MALTLEAGTPVGKYVVKRKLAEGGMAEIYVAAARGPEGFEKEVVLKRVRSYLSTDPEFVQMFSAEARLASRLNHANIVQIFDFYKHEDTYYLAMEYVRGRSLWDVRRRARELMQPMRPTLVAHVGLEVARGLHYAHRLTDKGEPLNLVHRDVTPHNVLMSWEGAIKLTDFGIAKAGNKLTSPGMLKGKFAYMSPEQARGDAVDARTDVFALGIVLWEMLTGGKLFEGDSDVAVLRAVQQSAIAPPGRLNADVPAELDQIVMKALAREVGERWQNAQELERALARFILGHAQSIEETDLGAYLRRLYQDELSPEGHEFTTAGVPNPLPPETSQPRREPTAVMPGSRSGPRTPPALLDPVLSPPEAAPAPPSPDEDPHGATFVPNQRRTQPLPAAARSGSKPGIPVPAAGEGSAPAVLTEPFVAPGEADAAVMAPASSVASSVASAQPVSPEASPEPADATDGREEDAAEVADVVSRLGSETVRFDQEELRAAIAARRAENARHEATQVTKPPPPAPAQKRRTPSSPRPSVVTASRPAQKSKPGMGTYAVVGAVVLVAAVAGVIWKVGASGPAPLPDAELAAVAPVTDPAPPLPPPPPVVPAVRDAGQVAEVQDAGSDDAPVAQGDVKDAGPEALADAEADADVRESPSPASERPARASDKGKIVIQAHPWAVITVDGQPVYIDGKKLEDVAGRRVLELPVGRRVIRLVHPQRTLERTVVIKPSETVRITFTALKQ